MNRHIITAFFLASSTPALSQQSTASLAPPVLVDPRVAALRDNALENDHYAWDVVEEVLIRYFNERLVTSPRQGLACPYVIL